MSFSDFLDRVPKLNAGLTAAASVMSKTVLQRSLVPINLDWLGGAGIVVAIIAFLCVWAKVFSAKAKFWLIGLAAVSLLGVLFMRIELVESFQYYGENYNELRGWELSPYGVTLKSNLEKALHTQLSMHDVIYYSDHTLMTQLFGTNWYLSAALYVGCFLTLLFSVVAAQGVFELEQPTRVTASPETPEGGSSQA